MFVGKAQFEEMAAWRNLQELRKKNAPDADIDAAKSLLSMYSKQKVGVFYVDRPSWKVPVVNRGYKLFLQAMAALEGEKVKE